MKPINFDNSYARLPDSFYRRVSPSGVSKPELIRVNRQLADELGIKVEWLVGDEGIGMMAGCVMPNGAEPIASVYAGHQFGHYVPRLGDGRAMLVGEVVTSDNSRFDIQLKGSGPTPYSRGGDGRSPLGPVLREYIVSEAMYNLGIPTTRALGAIQTGDKVMREGELPGAILTRVAGSHIRIGTHQYFAAYGDFESLNSLVRHVVDRHYPEVKESHDYVLEMLGAVIARQADLIAKWQLVGFVHGVMNTDNMLLSGDTVDYGPCAFIDGYDEHAVYSSIDRAGRYA
ncbi:MAG: protein adenylyltransferase SelO family protein, partial [Anaerolineales bacterium]